MQALARGLVEGTGVDPDDLVQDAFVAALERRPRRDSSLRPWLGRVVRNRFAFSLRGASRRRAREQDAAAAEAVPAGDELLERAELHGRVVRALTELHEPQRSVLLLRYFAGLTPSDIARRRGVPAATVRSQIHRGLQELRLELDRSLGDDRERCRLALLALAYPPQGVRPTLLEKLRTMDPAVQLFVAASTAVVAGGLYLLGPEPPSGISDSPTTLSSEHAQAEPMVAPQPPANRVALAPLDPDSTSLTDESAVTGSVRGPDGQPLRAFALRLSHAEPGENPVWSEPELLCTDDAGHFASLHTYPKGTIRISLIDHPGMRIAERLARQHQEFSAAMTGVSRDWMPGQGSVDLKATVGPSCSLGLSGLGELKPDLLTGSLEPVEEEPWGALPEAWVAMAPVRAGEPPWIRFPDLRGSVQGERPWRMRIESADGLVAGEVQVQLEHGALPASVTIALAPSARLDVTLVTGAQTVDPSLALEPLAGGERRPMLPVSVEALAGGGREVRFTRTALPPGTYQVLVSIDAVDQLVDTVTLVASESASRTIDLGATPASTRVAGELRSKSGTLQELMTVCIKDAAGKFLHREPVQWVQQGSEWIAPFAIDNLPAQVCELELVSMGSRRRWSALPMHFVPPQTGLLLVCDDVEPVRVLCIRVHDAGTGAPIGGSGTIALAGCETSETMFSGGKGSTSFLDVPPGALTEWYASAEGYVPRWGGL
jgi:RNA polymerase sigma-70 factor (ECF subfamily)